MTHSNSISNVAVARGIAYMVPIPTLRGWEDNEPASPPTVTALPDGSVLWSWYVFKMGPNGEPPPPEEVFHLEARIKPTAFTLPPKRLVHLIALSIQRACNKYNRGLIKSLCHATT